MSKRQMRVRYIDMNTGEWTEDADARLVEVVIGVKRVQIFADELCVMHANEETYSPTLRAAL